MTTLIDAPFDLDALDTVREKLQLDWEDLAATVGVDQSTLYRWRHRESAPRPVYRSRLQQVSDLVELLPRVFAGPDLARDWLQHARPGSFGGTATPLDLMRGGRIDRVLLLLHLLARGG